MTNAELAQEGDEEDAWTPLGAGSASPLRGGIGAMTMRGRERGSVFLCCCLITRKVDAARSPAVHNPNPLGATYNVVR